MPKINSENPRPNSPNETGSSQQNVKRGRRQLQQSQATSAAPQGENQRAGSGAPSRTGETPSRSQFPPADELRRVMTGDAGSAEDQSNQSLDDDTEASENESLIRDAERHVRFNEGVLRAFSMDLRELSTAGDKPRSELLRTSGVQLPEGRTISLQSLHDQLDDAILCLEELEGTNPELHKRFTGYIEEAKTSIADFCATESKYPVLTKAIVALATNLPLLSLPLLLGTDPAKVKDVADGESRVSRDFTMIIAAYAVKSIALVLSHALSPLSNAESLKIGITERRAYDIVSFLTGAPTTFSKTLNDKFGQSAGYAALRAGVSLGALTAVFQKEATGKFANKLATAAQSLAVNGTTEGATEYPRLEREARGLPESEKEVLGTVAKVLKSTAVDIYKSNMALVEQGIPNSPAFTEKSGQAQSVLFKAAAEMNHLAGASEGPDHQARMENPDRTNKLMIFALTGLVYAANLALVRNDWLPVVDTILDGGAVMPFMWQAVTDPSVSASEAKDRFKTFAGTNLVAAILLGADELAGKPTQKYDEVFYGMIAVFAAASLTLPAPVSQKFVDVLNDAMNLVKSLYTPQTDAGPEEVSEVLTENPDDRRRYNYEFPVDRPDNLQYADEVTSEAVTLEMKRIVTAGSALLRETIEDVGSLETLGESVGDGLEMLTTDRFSQSEDEKEVLQPHPRIEDLEDEEIEDDKDGFANEFRV